MTNEPVQPHFEFAVKTSLAQIQRQQHGRNQQMSRQRASSTAYAHGGMIPAPGVTQGAYKSLNFFIFFCEYVEYLL